MLHRKVEISVILAIIGWLVSAGIRAVNVEQKVIDHDSQIKEMNVEIHKISNDTAFIRGMMERGRK